MNDDALGKLYRRAMVQPRAGDGEACPSPEALRAVAERTAGERGAPHPHGARGGLRGLPTELALLGQVVATRPAARRSLVPARWLAAAAVVALAVLGGRPSRRVGASRPSCAATSPR